MQPFTSRKAPSELFEVASGNTLKSKKVLLQKQHYQEEPAELYDFALFSEAFSFSPVRSSVYSALPKNGFKFSAGWGKSIITLSIPPFPTTAGDEARFMFWFEIC